MFNATFIQYKIEHTTSSADQLQTIGKVERFNKFLENSLSTLIKKDQTGWPKYVESCLFVDRTTFNRGVNVILFFLMYGRDPIMPQDLLIPSSERNIRTIRNEDLHIYKSRFLHIIRQTHNHLDAHKQGYQAKNKQFYDKTKKQAEFKSTIRSELSTLYLKPKD